MLWRPGDRLGGYRLSRVLGQGGFAEVWLATTPSGDEVAVKILHGRHVGGAAGPGPSPADRFLAEARLIEALAHPGVVRILDVVDDRPRAIAYAMEKLDGRTLGDLEPKLPLADLLGMFAGICDTLAFLHDNGVVHRDVKLANIFVCEPSASDPRRAVKLIDFGVAKDLEAQSAIETATGMFIGTLQTMAPECFDRLAGKEVELTGAVDQWGVGVAMYRCLAGVPPFRSAGVFDLITEIQTSSLAPMQLIDRHQDDAIAEALDRMVRRCLAKRPVARFESCVVLAAELRTLAQEAAAGATVPRDAATQQDEPALDTLLDVHDTTLLDARQGSDSDAGSPPDAGDLAAGGPEACGDETLPAETKRTQAATEIAPDESASDAIQLAKSAATAPVAPPTSAGQRTPVRGGVPRSAAAARQPSTGPAVLGVPAFKVRDSEEISVRLRAMTGVAPPEPKKGSSVSVRSLLIAVGVAATLAFGLGWFLQA